jgi:hypothetical protein
VVRVTQAIIYTYFDHITTDDDPSAVLVLIRYIGLSLDLGDHTIISNIQEDKSLKSIQSKRDLVEALLGVVDAI